MKMTIRQWTRATLLCATTVACFPVVACSSGPSANEGTADAPTVQPKPARSGTSTKTPVKSSPDAPSIAWTMISTKTDDAAAVREAVVQATGVPVVYIGATWCGPCKQYKAALSDPRMIEAHTGAHIIELDADKHTKTLTELGIRPAGVPHWEMVDKTANPTGRTIDGSHWQANTPQEMAPALGKFFGLGHG